MSNRKGLLLAIAIIIMGMFITAGSYAFWSWASDINKTVTYNTAKNLQNYIIYEVGNSQFSGQFKAVNSYTDGMSSTIMISKTSEAANVDLMAIIHMDINQIGDLMKSSPALKWVVTQGNEILAQGNFVGANNGDTLDLANNIEVTTTPTAYTIWIWLDKNAHPSSALSGETLDTNVWTEITQTAGAEDRFEITRINANYQNISATVVDSKHKVTHYAVVTSGNTPNTWTSIGTASNIYNLNTTVNAAGTYDVYFKDQNNRTTHKSVTVDAVDTTAPSCTFGSFTPVQVFNNQTATIELTCTDNESDITVNNLTTSDITKSNNSINITNISKTAIDHGYKYTITVTGTENDGDTTLTLDANKIRNAVSLGNAAVTSSAVAVRNDTIAPTVEDITGGTTPKQTSQTLTLKCSDNREVSAYYFGTTDPTSANAITTTTAANLTALTSASGLSQSVSAAGTYYFACRDAAGNFAKKSIIINSYTIKNMLVTTGGTIASYSTANYGQASSTTYYVKNGTTLNIADIYTIPNGSNANRFNGFSEGAASATEVTPNTVDTSITINSNITYSMWFTRNVITFRYKIGAGETLRATTTDSGTTYTWSTNEDGFIMRSTNGGTAVIQTSSYRYGIGSIDLINYNNTKYLYITKTGFSVNEDKAWICISGCKTIGQLFNQRSYSVTLTNFCENLASQDCTIVLGVNWVNKSYTLTLNGNGATTAGTGSVTVKYLLSTLNPSTIVLPEREYTISYNMGDTGLTAPEGSIVTYTFNGYYSASSGGTQVLNPSTTPTLQASSAWTNANGEWNYDGARTAYARWTSDSIQLPVISKPYYTCKWAEGTIDGTQYDGGTTRTPTSNTTYYAICEPYTYTVRFYNSGYQEVEYIGSTGTQYIDTEYRHNQNTRILADIDFQPTAAWQSPFGSWGGPNSSPKKMFGAEYSSDSKTLNLYYGNSSRQSITTKSIYTGRRIWDFNKNVWKIGDTTKTFTAATFQSELNDYIFATSGYGEVSGKTTVKVYSFKIYESDELARDFVPCYRISDGEIGLFDVVNYKFYPNSGTNLFNKGNDVYDNVIIKEQSFTYGTSQRLDANTYDRNGYVFNGWNTSLDGTGTSYTDQQLVENLTSEPGGIIDLYAKWLTNDYNIQFISSNELCTLMGPAYANATVGYNDDINVPNPTCAGFNFAGWTSYTISNGAKSGTTANPTIYWSGASTKNTYFKNLAGRPNATVTMIANWTKTDNTAPTLTVGTSESGTTYTKSKTATITLSDNVMFGNGTYTIKYGWSTSALTCADMTDTKTITVIAGETSKTTQVTFDTVTGAGRLYVCNPDAIDDRVGNTLAADTVSSTQMYLDNTPPTGTMTLANNGGVKTTLTVTDANAGMGSTYYYLIDTSPITCDASTTGYNEASTNTYTFTVYSTGLYYVCAKTVDTAGNAAYFTGSIVVKAYLKTLSGDNDAFKDATYKTNITNIYFVNNVSIPNDAVATYDLDDTNVGLIKGWIVDNPNETGKYLLYIGSNDPIYGRNLSNLFKDMTGVKSIDFTNFNTSEATTMAYMFSGTTRSLTSLDLSNFDTSNVTSMNHLFSDGHVVCKLESIKFGQNFDTSKVKNMAYMFMGCYQLVYIDLSSFDTSSLTDMNHMFRQCDKLQVVNLSSFDTSKVTNMQELFYYDSALLTVYVSSNLWNVDAVSNSSQMFRGDNKLVGGNGTVFNSSYENKVRAYVDAPGTTGYLTEVPTTNMLKHGTSVANTGYFLSTNIVKNKIKKITFTDSITGHTANGTDTWDVSFHGNGSVLAWVGTADENGRYEMTIGQNGGVVASSGYYLFSNLNNLTSIAGMQYFDTSNVSNMRYMFYGCSNLTSIDLTHFDTSSATSMTNMFGSCSKLTTLNLSNFNTAKAKHMASMFNGCSSLTSITFGSSFNTSNVTTMNSMFYGCSKLTTLNLSGFNTSNVTNMASMFYNCSKLTALDLSNFNTSKVTTMDSMFYGCSSLASLDLISFDTSKVTTMANMFYGCSNITSLDLSDFDTSSVTTMASMFQNCGNLLVIYASSSTWDVTNVTTSTNMFTGASSLVGGNGTLFSTSYVDKTRALIDTSETVGYLTEKPTSNMLQHGTKGANTTNFLSTNILKNQIKKITFTNSISGHTPNGTDTWDVSLDKNGSVLAWVGGHDGNGRYEMTIGQNGGVVASSGYGLFSYLNNLTAIDGMEYFDTSNVANMYLMFDGDSSLTTINLSNFSTVKATMMRAMFRNCSSLTTLNLSNFDTSKVTNMGAMFDGNTNLTTLNISSFDTSNVTAMDYMFQNCSSLTTLNLSNFNTSNVTTMSYMFYGTTALSNLNISSFNTSKVTTMSYMFSNNKGLTNLDLTHFSTPKVTTMREMFASTKLVTINLSGWTNEKLTSMQRMFMSSSRIQSIDFTNFQTPLVDGLSQTFDGCNALRGLDLSSFTTTNMTALSWTFRNCSTLSYLNLSNFDTSNVTNTQEMFNGCSNLSTIYVTSNLWNMDNVTTHTNMFKNASYLAGGNGTVFSSSYVNKARAVIDTDATPGYLTAAPTSNVLEPGSVNGNTANFLSTSIVKNKIKKITFTNTISGHSANGTDTWDVSFQKNGSVLAWVGTADGNGMYEMTIGQTGGVVPSSGYGLFAYLNNLTAIDGMEYLDVSDVTLMRSMFQGDTSLTTLDLSSWDTSKVKLMNNMFNGCSNLTTIYASSLWDTSNLSNSATMFTGATNLPNFNSSVVDATNAHTGTGGYLTYKAYP